MKKIFGLLLFFTLLMGQAAMAQQDIAELLRKAQAGDAVSQYYLGMCYEVGEGVTQSYTEAVKWFRKAAEQGNASAQGALGSCNEEGNGVKKSKAEAIKWYNKAAKQGDYLATYRLKELGITNYD